MTPPRETFVLQRERTAEATRELSDLLRISRAAIRRMTRPALARPESTRERVRHAARRDGLLLHQVLADEQLVARYGAEALVA